LFESLEHRDLMAGDVTAQLANGTLVIKGDTLDNGVQLSTGPNSGEIVVAGTTAGGSATNLNGTANGSATFSNVTGLKIAMKGGNDNVQFEPLTIDGNTRIRGGRGNDTFDIGGAVFNGSLNLKLGRGDDKLTWTSSTVSGEAEIKGRRGSDEVSIASGTFDTLSVRLGRGDDSLSISGTTVHTETDLNGGLGTNTFTDGGGNTLNGLTTKNFA